MTAEYGVIEVLILQNADLLGFWVLKCQVTGK